MFVYFVEAPVEKKAWTLADVKAAGLGYIAPDEGSPEYRRVVGPEGKSGLLFSYERIISLTEYKPDQQTWKPGPGGKYSVGFWNQHRPTEATLRREKMIAGEPVKLRDGAEWTVPIARSVVGGATLPQSLVLGEDFETWQRQDLPEYLAICQDAEMLFDLLYGGEEPALERKIKIGTTEAMRIIANAMSINYRVSKLELSMLALFTQAEMWAALLALIDHPGMLRMVATREKKADPSVSPSTSDGSAVG